MTWQTITRSLSLTWWRIDCLHLDFRRSITEFGYARFSLLEMAGLEKHIEWSRLTVVLAQILVLHSVCTFSPQLNQLGRRRFCHSMAQALYDLSATSH